MIYRFPPIIKSYAVFLYTTHLQAKLLIVEAWNFGCRDILTKNLYCPRRFLKFDPEAEIRGWPGVEPRGEKSQNIFFSVFSHFFDSMCKINVLNCHKTGLFELKGLFLTQNGKIKQQIFYVLTRVDDSDAKNWLFLT